MEAIKELTMNFRNPTGSNVFIGFTPKGSTVEYHFISESKIVYWKDIPNLPLPDLDKMSGKQLSNFADKQKEATEATRIRIHCSFLITTKIADLIEKSKICYVEYVNNENGSYMVIIPRPLFDYGKLNEVLYDVFEKFDL